MVHVSSFSQTGLNQLPPTAKQGLPNSGFQIRNPTMFSDLPGGLSSFYRPQKGHFQPGRTENLAKLRPSWTGFRIDCAKQTSSNTPVYPQDVAAQDDVRI